MRAACLAVVGAVATLPIASAQTFEEAVRINAAIALELCLTGGSDMAAWAGRFRAAGFAERVERSTSNSDTTHYFSAPADTVRIELYYGEMPEYCSVQTNHLNVTDAASILDQVVPRLYPSYARRVTPGEPDPTTGAAAQCVRYEDPASAIGHVVGAMPSGNRGDCVNDGTTTFFSSYRV